ncbi:MAG: hypothetical protein HQL79_10185 [Magnetococcales bacterium]|nr:hypothetical protein [Magnetococcales bacterium]
MKFFFLFGIVSFIVCAGGPIVPSMIKEANSKEFSDNKINEDNLRIYHWRGTENQTFITIHAKGRFEPEKFFSGQNGIIADPSHASPPISPPDGFIAYTYELKRVVTASQTLLGPRGLPLVYLIGETHIGKSQISVAKIIMKLIRENEIDAILLEQPDTIQFDWSKYRSLEAQPDKVIAALQAAMLSDSEGFVKSKPNFGIYGQYLNNFKSKEDLEKGLSRLAEEKGETELTKAIKIIEEEFDRLGKIHDRSKPIWERYEKSMSVSAADYLYITLHLKGKPIPFHGIEGSVVRSQFEKSMKNSELTFTDEEILPRDKAMTANAVRIIKENNYSRVILICGAFHLGNLSRLLAQEKIEPSIVYDSLKAGDTFKPVMITNYPDRINNIVNSSTVTAINSHLVPDNAPSLQITDGIIALMAKSGMALPASDVQRVQQQVAEKYSAAITTPGNEAWEIPINIGQAKTVTIRKDPRRQTFSLDYAKPLEATELDQLKESLSGAQVNLDAANFARLNKVNVPSKGIRLVTVDLFSTGGVTGQYFATDGSRYFTADSPQKLLNMVLEGSDKKSVDPELVYFDLNGLSPNKVDAFKHGLNAANNEDWRAKVLTRRDGDTAFQDALFEGRVSAVQNRHAAVHVTKVTSGVFKDWFSAAFPMTVSVGKGVRKMAFTLFARTEEIALSLAMALREKLGQDPKTIRDALSPSDLVVLLRKEMRKLGHSQLDFSIEVADESNENVFTEIKHEISGG